MSAEAILPIDNAETDALLSVTDALRCNEQFHLKVIKEFDLAGVTALAKLGFFNPSMNITTPEVQLRVMEMVTESLLKKQQTAADIAQLVKPVSSNADKVIRLANEMVVRSRMKTLAAAANDLNLPVISQIFDARRDAAELNIDKLN